MLVYFLNTQQFPFHSIVRKSLLGWLFLWSALPTAADHTEQRVKSAVRPEKGQCDPLLIQEDVTLGLLAVSSSPKLLLAGVPRNMSWRVRSLSMGLAPRNKHGCSSSIPLSSCLACMYPDSVNLLVYVDFFRKPRLSWGSKRQGLLISVETNTLLVDSEQCLPKLRKHYLVLVL